MIFEVAILDIKPGPGPAFVAALTEARPLIAATPGFIQLELLPCLEKADRYLLFVRWESVEAHTQGFRGSDRYPEWKKRLHHFYDPFPTVEHYGGSVAAA